MHPITDTQYLLDICYEPTPELPGILQRCEAFMCSSNAEPTVKSDQKACHCADAWDLRPRAGIDEASEIYRSGDCADARGTRGDSGAVYHLG